MQNQAETLRAELQEMFLAVFREPCATRQQKRTYGQVIINANPGKVLLHICLPLECEQGVDAEVVLTWGQWRRSAVIRGLNSTGVYLAFENADVNPPPLVVHTAVPTFRTIVRPSPKLSAMEARGVVPRSIDFSSGWKRV